ncbi:TPA: MFS transporter [Enterococcus faecium]|uniref:MFS transporter n=1 Tax=Enterococcus faecium TaxID=1352 RepID=UPI000CD42AA4|nr:MFS transporter [Enterococcus faecium]MDQ8533344.1 MFS transporter [Enterococcus faecium]POH48222.1 MFS transporter [Enterococcus faecium]HAZ1197605.1 MFS transporter [Enterococcus faecium]HBB6791495.1 MFS transporter [Enterococcus faecium]HBB6796986.1 MFS transporter [Enterococcus faecium]
MRDQTSGKMIRFYYTSLQFLYWMMFCSVYGFATLFLIYFKIDPAKIGGILALVNIVSTVLQPFISQVIIKKRKIPLITVLKTMTAGLGVILLAGVLLPNLPIITYILGGILVVSMQSFLNALAFEYSNTGYRINFGFSRAGGSFSYAVTSFLLGQLLAIYSAAILPILVIVEAVVFFVILHLLPDVKNQEVFPMTKEQDRPVSLRKKYPFLILLFLGFSFLFTFHTMINSFLAQIFENIHGGSKEVGIALMIAALCELPGMIFFEQLVKKKSSKFWLSIASISFAVRGFMMLLAGSILMMEMTHLLQAFSFALFIPASAYLFNQFLADDDRVFGQTMIIIATTLGGVIGNVLGGSLLQHFGVWEMLIFGTSFAVLGALLTILGIRKIPKTGNDSDSLVE